MRQVSESFREKLSSSTLSSSAATLCNALKAPSRLADRCVPACLLVGTSTGSWTKRELPLASSLCQPLRIAPRRGNRVSCRFLPSFLPFPPLSIFLPSFLVPLAPSYSRPVLLTRGRRAWRTLDMCEFATSSISRKQAAEIRDILDHLACFSNLL